MSPRTEQILCALGCAVMGAVVSSALFDACGCSPTPPTPPRIEDRDRCKKEALHQIAFELSMFVGGEASARAMGTPPDPKEQKRIEGLRAEYRRIEKDGCGL